MNALCFSVAALPQLPRWPLLASHFQCLSMPVAVRERRCGHKERAEVQEEAWLAQNVGSGLQKRDIYYVWNAQHATRVARICDMSYSSCRGIPRSERLEHVTRVTRAAREARKPR